MKLNKLPGSSNKLPAEATAGTSALLDEFVQVYTLFTSVEQQIVTLLISVVQF
jgi:hypothetical protein